MARAAVRASVSVGAKRAFSATRLTAFTDYMRRALMYLGLHRDRLSAIAEIARERIGLDTWQG